MAIDLLEVKSAKDSFILLNVKLIKKLHTVLSSNIATDCRPLLDAYYLHARELCVSNDYDDFYKGPHFSRHDINMEEIVKSINKHIKRQNLKLPKKINKKKVSTSKKFRTKDNKQQVKFDVISKTDDKTFVEIQKTGLLGNVNTNPTVPLPVPKEVFEFKTLDPKNIFSSGTSAFETATPILKLPLPGVTAFNDSSWKNTFLSSTTAKQEDNHEGDEEEIDKEPTHDLAIDKDSYAHFECALYYSEDTKWVKLGPGIVNLHHVENKMATHMIVRQHPSISGTVLLNFVLVKELTPVKNMGPQSVVFVASIKTSKVDVKDKPVMIKFTQSKAREEFWKKLFH